MSVTFTANEQVALEGHTQLLDAVLDRDQELQALLGAAKIDGA
jgi:hypothetical protein